MHLTSGRSSVILPLYHWKSSCQYTSTAASRSSLGARRLPRWQPPFFVGRRPGGLLPEPESAINSQGWRNASLGPSEVALTVV